MEQTLSVERLDAMRGVPVYDSSGDKIGSVEEICDTIERRRETFGISYYTFYQPDLVTMAPVVERLSGR